MRIPLIVSIGLHVGTASVLWAMQGAAPAQFPGEEPIVIGWVDAPAANTAMPAAPAGGVRERQAARMHQAAMPTHSGSRTTADCECGQDATPSARPPSIVRTAQAGAAEPTAHALEPVGVPAAALDGSLAQLALRVGAGDVPARPRPTALNVPPVYPESARQRAEEGTVVLRVRVGADGWAEGIAVMQSSGFSDLDQAAMQSVRQWAFVPAVHAGVSVPGSAAVTLCFRLVDSG